MVLSVALWFTFNKRRLRLFSLHQAVLQRLKCSAV